MCGADEFLCVVASLSRHPDQLIQAVREFMFGSSDSTEPDPTPTSAATQPHAQEPTQPVPTEQAAAAAAPQTVHHENTTVPAAPDNSGLATAATAQAVPLSSGGTTTATTTSSNGAPGLNNAAGFREF